VQEENVKGTAMGKNGEWFEKRLTV